MLVLSEVKTIGLYPEQNGVFGIKGFPNGKIHFVFDNEGVITEVRACLLDGPTLWKAIPNRN